MAYQNAASCCETLRSVSFEKLPFGRSTRISISATDPAFAFKSGISFFRAFELPNFDNGSEFVATSTLFLVPGKGNAYFYPVLTLLDANRSVIATIDLSDMPVITEQIHGSSPATISVGFVINQFPEARYVVVHTTSNLVLNGHAIHGDIPASEIGVAGVIVRTPGSPFEETDPGSPVAPGTLEIEERAAR